ncbi:histidine kinase [Nonomuraea angiospora]|uniref:sensor histidine kinase n=1 Tax=Nonomuraea angiospora TaxID=46172 RepID=UPI00331BBE26
MLVAIVAAIGGIVSTPSAGWTVTVPAVAAVFGLVAPGERGRGHRRTGVSACVAAAVSLLCTALHRGPVTGLAGIWVLVEPVGLAALVSTAVRYARVRMAIGAGALGVLSLGTQPLRMLQGASATWTEYVFFLGCWTLAGLAAVTIGLASRLAARRRSQARAEIRHRERLALAGDLHDLVAHDVTGIVLEAQATRAEADPAQAPEALDRIEQAGLQALAAMDRTVAILRSGAAEPGARLYGVADLAELTDRFTATGRIPVHLDITPDLADRVSREAADAAYRLVAEALTNVRRHASHATGVSVTLTTEATTLRLRIADTGSRPPASRPPHLPRARGHGGAGLLGLAARFETLGGTLNAGPDRTGWLVQATLPLAEAAT